MTSVSIGYFPLTCIFSKKKSHPPKILHEGVGYHCTRVRTSKIAWLRCLRLTSLDVYIQVLDIPSLFDLSSVSHVVFSKGDHCILVEIFLQAKEPKKTMKINKGFMGDVHIGGYSNSWSRILGHYGPG